MRHLLSTAAILVLVTVVCADGPADNLPDKVRRVPPLPKDPVSAEVKSELQRGVDELGKEIEALRSHLKDEPRLLQLLPDVQIFHNAVRYAIAYDEIFDAKKEVAFARKQLEIGMQRAKALREKQAPWTKQTGLVVRGYVSKIDNSVQPYGLVVPADYEVGGPKRRLDLWCHGRGETLSELNFLNDRMNNRGQFTPPGAIVLHLYGRYCNANKFAGEIDCFEAMEHVKKHYPVDDDRIVMRGFSMGGAACWQFAVHYPDRWCAAAPGAGFSETAEFLNVFQNEKVQPTDYEKKLWHWYDCPDYAVNLFNLPTVAYSGEIDKQKQAADVMERALKKEKIDLVRILGPKKGDAEPETVLMAPSIDHVHIIGPKTGHSYHPDSKKEIDRRIDALASKGRNRWPKEIKFQTYTLRYNQSYWLTIDELEGHWEPAPGVELRVFDNQVKFHARGVRAVRLHMSKELCQYPPKKVELHLYENGIDDDLVARTVWESQESELKPDGTWTIELVKDGKEWKRASDVKPLTGLRKRHGLQGPIDDAFLDRFIMVRPTGQPRNEVAGKFADREMKHAITHWRQQFRGDAMVKDDAAITEADIAESNLVLWGDQSSNAVLAKIAGKLPIKWTKDGVSVGQETFPATHVPVLIYPNPLNPKRYVVVNSGFTFREYDYLNNARQVPKLPDYAVIDATTPMTSRGPGKVVAAGFFDEVWQLKK